jgi:hypothetical protein
MNVRRVLTYALLMFVVTTTMSTLFTFAWIRAGLSFPSSLSSGLSLLLGAWLCAGVMYLLGRGL